MAFIQPCFIRKNTPELRRKLKDLGYHICSCSLYKDSAWLCSYNLTRPCSVHGIGSWDYDNLEKDTEKVLRFFVEENKTSLNPAVDCGVNEEMYLALAALRDDTDYMQWFICGDNESMFKVDKPDMSVEKYIHEYMDGWDTEGYRKATAEEIVEHFKEENYDNRTNSRSY